MLVDRKHRALLAVVRGDGSVGIISKPRADRAPL
jgi:hypothetical protein